MKKSLLLLALFTVAFVNFGVEASERVFGDAANIKGVSTTYISPAALKLSKPDINMGHGLNEAVRRIDGLEILEAETNESAPQLKKAAQNTIKKSGCELLTEISDGNSESTRIYAHINADNSTADIIIIEVDDPDFNDYTIIYVKGKIDLKSLMEENIN